MIVPTYPGHVVPRINFYGSEIRYRIFFFFFFWGGGVKFWSRDIFGFCLKP